MNATRPSIIGSVPDPGALALAAKKAQVARLGKSASAGSLGREALMSGADQFAANLLPLIGAIQSTGAVTLEAITRAE